MMIFGDLAPSNKTGGGEVALKITPWKQESTATIKLVNLATKGDSVFMASPSGMGPQQAPF
jgi:hypothetical protein